MDHEGTAGQPAVDSDLATTHAGEGDADVPTNAEATSEPVRADDGAQDPSSDVEAQVDGLLADLADRPLREQVDVFESVHAVLTDRLSEKDA